MIKCRWATTESRGLFKREVKVIEHRGVIINIVDRDGCLLAAVAEILNGEFMENIKFVSVSDVKIEALQ